MCQLDPGLSSPALAYQGGVRVNIVTHAYLVLGTELRAVCVLDKHHTLSSPSSAALGLQSEAVPYFSGEIPVSHLVSL